MAPQGIVRGSDVIARKARRYANEVAGEIETEVDLSDVAFEMSRRMTRAHGKCVVKTRPSGDQEITIKLSRKAYDNHGWESTQETIRHELIHVWQAQQGYRLSHGPTFTSLMDEFDVPDTTADDPADDYKYIVECDGCDKSIGRMRKSKLVKHPSRYRCGGCGGTLTSRAA